jgi:hypothetical protein
MKRAAFVRQLIRKELFVTGADVLKDARRRMGNQWLRISRGRGGRFHGGRK